MKPTIEKLVSPKQFSGWAPILPLPGEVLFPHILLPLHVSDPRHCALVADAVQGAGLIALALPHPGWEVQADFDQMALFETVCLGQVMAETQFADGEYTFAVQGLTRARVLQEHLDGSPYRVAELQLLPDRYPANGLLDRRSRQREILLGLCDLFAQMDLDKVIRAAIDAEIPLGGLCDVIAYSIGLEPCVALGILEEQNVDLRSDLVLECLSNLAQPTRSSEAPTPDMACSSGFLPPFSPN